MIMEDPKNEGNNSSDRSMSPISESLSETSSGAESNSSNLPAESNGLDADIIDEINKKTKTGKNKILMFIYNHEGSE